MAKRVYATHVEMLQKHMEGLKLALDNSPWAGGSLEKLVYTMSETRREFVKRLWLSAIPRVLCLHLNRLVDHEVKLSHHVMFQLKLDVKEFCLLGGQYTKESATYSLQSVVVHRGTSRYMCAALITITPEYMCVPWNIPHL